MKIQTLPLLMSLLFLGACNPVRFAGSLVCLSGICPTAETRVSKIPWEPPSLNYAQCPDINGKYRIGSFLWSDVSVYFTDIDGDETIRKTIIKDIKEIPFHKKDSGKIFEGKPVFINDETEFWKNEAITVIQKTNEKLILQLTDNQGELYREKTIDLNHPRIGCHEDAFFVRSVDVSFGTEGGPGMAGAKEWKFTRPNNHVLQVTTHERMWLYYFALGFGLDSELYREERRTAWGYDVELGSASDLPNEEKRTPPASRRSVEISQ